MHFKIYGQLAELLVKTESHTVTKYLSPKHTVKATRISYGGKINKRERSISIRFENGKPNYHARQFIKSCLKAKEPFPIRKIQVKYFPKKR